MDMTNQTDQPVTNPDPNAVPAQPAATPPADVPAQTPPVTDDGGMAGVTLPGEEKPEAPAAPATEAPAMDNNPAPTM